MEAITLINFSFVELQRHWRHLKGFPDSSVGKESACNAGDPSSIPGLGRFPGEGIGYPLLFLGFPCGSAGRESSCNVGDLGSIPGLGTSPGEWKRVLTPVFWPGEFHELYSPWSHKESDLTEQLSLWRHYMGINYIKYAKINTFNQNRPPKKAVCYISASKAVAWHKPVICLSPQSIMSVPQGSFKNM